MNCTATRLSFSETGYFSRIITDYLSRAEALEPFYGHPASLEGIVEAIKDRERFNTPRELLVRETSQQYQSVETSPLVRENIEKLASPFTFTITTAHQPAIFTGTLYFVYKILHVIRLSRFLAKSLPQYQFVPVFYMGSEDADLDELGHIYLEQEKLAWDTLQRGAVGRMKTTGLEKILDRIAGQYGNLPHGAELVALLKEAYLGSEDIQTATFALINRLFANHGLVVIIPDKAGFKRELLPVFQDDLFNGKPSAIVGHTISQLSQHYKVQAAPREINLFYLKNDLRGRIERSGDRYVVHDSRISFSGQEISAELQAHPERFSPNVILRGLLQETILPNIAFVGGGGETAYWLELRALFEHYQVPFPVLVLRNSFLIVEDKWKRKMDMAGLGIRDIFRKEEDLVNQIVRQESREQLSLTKERKELESFYLKLKELARPVDQTLVGHVNALETRAIKTLEELEKKLFRAEKRKYSDRRGQIHQLKTALFPLNGLQERIDNFIPYFAKYGPRFLEMILAHSLALEQEFVVLSDIQPVN